MFALVVTTFLCAGSVHLDPDVAIQLGPRMEVLVDDATALDAARAMSSTGFVQTDREVPSWGFGRKVIWARFTTLPAHPGERWFLRAGFPRPDRVELWRRDKDGALTMRSVGGLDLLHTSFAQDVTLPIDLVGAQETILRIDTQPARINLHLVEEQTLIDLRAREMLVAGVYFGIFLGLFLYNAFLGLSLRDGTHALYCTFLVCMAMHIAARDGIGFAEVPPVISRGGAGLAMTSLVMLVFTRRFLRLKDRAAASAERSAVGRTPRQRALVLVDRVIVAQLAVYSVIAVCALLGAPFGAGGGAGVGISIITVVVAAVIVSLDGDRPARWFLLAWSVLIASCIWAVLHAFGITDANAFTVDAMKVGSALEMVLLSLALAARVRALRAEKDRAELALASARANAQAELAGRVIEAQEDERARFARELHDGLGHALLMIKERLQRAVRTGALLEVEEAKQLGADAQECIDDARAMARNLVPPSLSRLGLVEALRGACADMSRGGELEVRFSDEGAEAIEDSVFGDRAIHLVRIVQESLANALRHGRARHVSVSIRADAGAIVVVVADDGVGFDTGVHGAGHGAGAGLGLLDMEQRARILGGSIAFTSTTTANGASPAGTRVECRVPIGAAP